MDEIKRIRLLIADDHPLVRTGIRNALSVFADIELAAEAENGAQALLLANENTFDVALIDLFMPEVDGFSIIEKLSLTMPCVALTSSQIPEEILRAAQCGAKCVLMKNVGGETIAKAIRAVFNNEPFYEETVTDLIMKSRLLEKKRSDPFAGLTSRETEVLRLVAKGFSNDEIAERLFVCRKTVKFHVSNILAKTGVSDRIKLAVLYHDSQRQ